MIAVIGGAGYIGSHAVKRLLEKGGSVAVFDNLSTGHRWAVPDAASLYVGDLRISEEVDDFFKRYKPEAVLHFGGKSLVGESVEKPMDYFETNVTGTVHLLKSMAKFGTKKIIFSSSASVYAGNDGSLLTETDAVGPKNPYGASKYMIEQMLDWASKAGDLKYVALRYFNVAGADPSGEIGEAHAIETHLVPNVLKAALGETAHISIFGTDYPTPDGTCIRDYVHVGDLIEAHLLALEYLGRGEDSAVFNLGSGTGFSVREIVDIACEVTGRDIPVELGPRRAGDPAKLVASSEKARRILGWQPQRTEIKTIVEDAWRWHNKK